jgi:hypothetical protein
MNPNLVNSCVLIFSPIVSITVGSMRVSWTMVFLSAIFSVDGVVPAATAGMIIFSSDTDSVNTESSTNFQFCE